MITVVQLLMALKTIIKTYEHRREEKSFLLFITTRLLSLRAYKLPRIAQKSMKMTTEIAGNQKIGERAQAETQCN